MRVLEKVEEAGLAAGIHTSDIAVVDYARQPVKPVAPDLPLYMAITFFAGLWLAVGGALMLESFASVRNTRGRAAAGGNRGRAQRLHAQAPTPSTSGLPTRRGQRFRSRRTTGASPIPRKRLRSGISPAVQPGLPASRRPRASHPCRLRSAPATCSRSASTTPRSFIPCVRVSAAGTVTLPMVGEFRLAGWTSRPLRTPLKRRWWPRECCSIRWCRCW